MLDLNEIIEYCKSKKLKLLYFYSDKNSQAYEIFDFKYSSHVEKFLTFHSLNEAQLKLLLLNKTLHISNTINEKKNNVKTKIVDAIKIYSFVL